MTNEIHLPDVSDDEDRLLNRLLKQLDEKALRNLLRASYYDGKRAIRQVGTVIPPQYYRLGIVLGWSAKAVDILARRCNLDGFVWPDGDLDSLGVREVWEENYLNAETNSAIVSSLIHGVSFLVNTNGGAGEPDSLIHVKSALNATGDINSRTRRLDNLLSIIARDDKGEPTKLALYLDGETILAEKDGTWEVDRQTHPWGVPAEPLIYKSLADIRPFGFSRISRPVMSLHDQALRTVIRMEGHMDIYSYPEMWLLGADMSALKNPDGSLKPSWEMMLGRIKGVKDDDEAENPRADVKQFPASSPQPHLEALKQQAQLFSGETSIPLTSLGVSDMSNPTSADSYIASREDLIAEAEGATDDWAPALRRCMIRALAIKNGLDGLPPQWRTVDTKWRNPLYLSRAAQADAGMKQLSAAPELAGTEVGYELLGLDEQQIARAMSEKRRALVATMVQSLSRQPVANDDSIARGAAVPSESSQPTR